MKGSESAVYSVPFGHTSVPTPRPLGGLGVDNDRCAQDLRCGWFRVYGKSCVGTSEGRRGHTCTAVILTMSKGRTVRALLRRFSAYSTFILQAQTIQRAAYDAAHVPTLPVTRCSIRCADGKRAGGLCSECTSCCGSAQAEPLRYDTLERNRSGGEGMDEKSDAAMRSSRLYDKLRSESLTSCTALLPP